MYCELLEKTIQELRGEDISDDIDPEVELNLPAYLPEDYIEELQSRLHHYRLLSIAETEGELYERMEELEDRFGPAPAPVLNLLEVMKIKLWMKQVRVRSLTRLGTKVVLRMDDETRIDRGKLVQLLSQQPKQYRLTADQKLVVELTDAVLKDPLGGVKNLLQKLR